MGHFSDMPDSNTAALRQYEQRQADADDRADEAEEYREQAIDEITDEIMADEARLSDALCASDAVNDGNALHALAVLTLATRRKQWEQSHFSEAEEDALNTVRCFVRDYVETWSDKVEERMYQLAGFDV